jgi:hypothetical protein
VEWVASAERVALAAAVLRAMAKWQEQIVILAAQVAGAEQTRNVTVVSASIPQSAMLNAKPGSKGNLKNPLVDSTKSSPMSNAKYQRLAETQKASAMAKVVPDLAASVLVPRVVVAAALAAAAVEALLVVLSDRRKPGNLQSVE